MILMQQRQIICSDCGYTDAYLNALSFIDLISSAKENGWNCYRNHENLKWHHTCPDCSKNHYFNGL